MVAGGGPRRGREIGEYLRVQGTIPRLWEVVVVAGKYHVSGDACSGGRRFGWSGNSSEIAAEVELGRGLDSRYHERVSDEVRAPEMTSPE